MSRAFLLLGTVVVDNLLLFGVSSKQFRLATFQILEIEYL